MNDKDKVRLYDEALKQAKKELNTCGSMDCDAARQIFRFFPQLKESEEERIRKWIVNLLHELHYNQTAQPMALKAIEYLEKQKEHHIPWYDYQKSKEAGYTIVPNEEYDRLTKPAEWNDEDYHWEGLVQFLRDYQKTIDRNSNNMTYEDVERYICWVNSLRPQPKQEWSKEDERMRDRIIDILNRTFSVYSALGTSSTRPSCPTYKDEIAWLKSLRPSWKPSEEQMGALQAVINDPNNAGSLTCQLGLQDLLNCLEKL